MYLTATTILSEIAHAQQLTNVGDKYGFAVLQTVFDGHGMQQDRSDNNVVYLQKGWPEAETLVAASETSRRDQHI